MLKDKLMPVPFVTCKDIYWELQNRQPLQQFLHGRDVLKVRWWIERIKQNSVLEYGDKTSKYAV